VGDALGKSLIKQGTAASPTQGPAQRGPWHTCRIKGRGTQETASSAGMFAWWPSASPRFCPRPSNPRSASVDSSRWCAVTRRPFPEFTPQATSPAPPWLGAHRVVEAIQAVEGLYVPATSRAGEQFPRLHVLPPASRLSGQERRALKEAGIEYKVGKIPFWPRQGRSPQASRMALPTALWQETRRALARSIIGENATELIAEMGLALDQELTAEEIHATIHALPRCPR